MVSQDAEDGLFEVLHDACHFGKGGLGGSGGCGAKVTGHDAAVVLYVIEFFGECVGDAWVEVHVEIGEV